MPQEAECVIFDYGEISRFELDAFYPKEPVCEPGAFLVEEPSAFPIQHTDEAGESLSGELVADESRL